jgi:pilus assembly protein CpaF
MTITDGDRPPAPTRRQHAELISRLRAEVADQLTARMRADQAAGQPPLDPTGQRVLAGQLIVDLLDREARTALAAGRPVLTSGEEDQVTQAIQDLLFGLGRLQRLLDDPQIENINANGCDRVWVRYADGRRVQVDPIADSDEELVELVRLAAARLGLGERRFDLASPLLDLRLPDGSRLFAAMAVVTRPCLAIRLHRYPTLTLDDLAANGTIDPALQAFLGAAVRARLNLIVSGGTSAGKTTLLRALAAEIPFDERLVTIEDSLELGLERFPEVHADVVAMEARAPNVEGEGAISVADLVRAALRMSPDRVIVGEVRGHEVIPMLNAMTQGNDGSMCTIHANSSAGAFGRLATYAIQAPERLPLEATNLLVAGAVDLVVHLSLDRPSGRRRVTSIREVTGADGALVLSNELFRPGADGLGVAAVPPREATMERLAAAGFDPAWLEHSPVGWRP